jgi:predicted nucleotidyltransferase
MSSIDDPSRSHPSPPDLGALVASKREAILRAADRRGAVNVRVFGSVARGEADEASDVDFLVDLQPGRNLLDLGGLLMDLEGILGRPVDVVTEKGLRPRLRERVLREAVNL